MFIDTCCTYIYTYKIVDNNIEHPHVFRKERFTGHNTHQLFGAI